MKKSIVIITVLLFMVSLAFAQIQSDIERNWGYAEIANFAPSADSIRSVLFHVWDGGVPRYDEFGNTNGTLSLGITCVSQTAGTPVTFVDSVCIRLTSVDCYVKGDTLWGKTMTITTYDTIRVGHPTRNSWNQKFNICDMQRDIVATSGSEHEGYMPAMMYLVEIWRIDLSDPAARFRMRIGFVVED